MRSKRYHHLFDLEYCNEKITSREALRVFLETLAQTIHMQILEGPILAQGVPTNPGLSAIAIVDMSHISIHTFSACDEALIDIFSCAPYDRQAVEKLCVDFFSTEKTVVHHKEVFWG